MVRTRVGYAGGTSKDPQYHNLGDHTETIEVDYDPEKISYKELLEVFWQSHDPARQPVSQQYKAAVFYHNEQQKKISEETRELLSSQLKGDIVTEILPYSGFNPAEDYHQKFNLRSNPALMEEFSAGDSTREFLMSTTAAARVNGYHGGYGTCGQLKAEIDTLGLSDDGRKRLLKRVCGEEKPGKENN